MVIKKAFSASSESKTAQKEKARENLEKAREKRSFYKRTSIELRNALVKSLSRYPKTVAGLAEDCKAHRQTIKRHLEFLEAYNVVTKDLQVKGGRKYYIWRVV